MAFLSKTIVMVPLPAAPLAGETLHQAASPSTIASHDSLVVNETVTFPTPPETTGEVFVPSANVI